MTDQHALIGTPHTEYWALKKPDWPTWSRSRTLPLWQAVALACDLDPANFEPFGPNPDQPIDGLFAPITPTFKDRIELARSAVGSGILKVVPAPDKEMIHAEVEMPHFASWLRTIRHKAPQSFPWTPEELRPGSHQWPWGSHTTKNLDLMARAADKFWKNYTPSDVSTAPISRDVIDWLVDHGMAKRTAEVVASLLRADGLPTGPR